MLTVLMVDSLADVVAVDGYVSLREAIEAANTNLQVGDAPAGSGTEADAITFDASLFTNGPATITLDGAQLELADDIQIDGPGADLLTIDADGLSRGFYVDTGVAASISFLTITGGFAEEGGGIFSAGMLTIDSTIISGNMTTSGGDGGYYGGDGGNGGGIFSSAGMLTITNTTISGNSTGGGGMGDEVGHNAAGSFGGDGGDGGSGAGIYVSGGALALINSTVSGNTTGGGGDGIVHGGDGGDGGGILVRGGTVTLTNSTISGNAAGSGGTGYYGGDGGSGGGMLIRGGTATLSNSTISDNSTGAGGSGNFGGEAGDGGIGGGMFVDGTSSLTLNHTIVAGNFRDNSADDDISGSVLADWSLIETTTGATISGSNNILNQDPILGPLADNGGPTYTHAIIADSPAFDAGDPTAVAGEDGVPEFDQRGAPFGRVFAGRIDIGAYELVFIDDQPPVGSLSASGIIEFDGNSSTLDSPSLRIAPEATDNSGATTEMRISYDGTTWDVWDEYSTTPFEVTLPQAVIDSADGDVTVYIQYRDAAGNESDAYSDTIEFTTLPALVTSTADTIVADAETTLREAILLGSLRPTQSVTFDAALYTSAPATITLAGAQLELTRNVQIDGPGADLVAIDADEESRVFYIDEGVTASIAGLTVTGGHATRGGGIFSQGILEIDSTIVSGNSTDVGANGDDGVNGGSGSHGGDGGGIFASGGVLTITNSMVTDNATGNGGNGGGGNYIGDTELNGNGGTGGSGGDGGGIFSSDIRLTITNSTVSGNLTGGGGNGGFAPNYDGGNGGNGGNGGGVFASGGELTIINSTMSGNSAGGGGDGSPRHEGGNGGNGGSMFASGAELTIIGSSISGNSTGDGGRGYSGSGNGGDGGGIFSSGGVLTITNSTISGNSTGDGNSNPYRSGGDGGDGGGLLVSGGTVALTDSAILSNSTGDGGSCFSDGGDGGDGGGILVRGGTMRLNNSTISGNSTGAGSDGLYHDGGDGGDGGGIFVGVGVLEIINMTIAQNSTGNGGNGGGRNGVDGRGGRGGGMFSNETSVPTLDHTIVAGNFQDSGASDDISGSVLADWSLIETTTGATINGSNNVLGQDPILGPLMDNGGATLTHALLPGSPALDAGDPTARAGEDEVPEFDQRGAPFGRVSGAGIDIGAYEFLDDQPPIGSLSASGIIEFDGNSSTLDSPSLRIAAEATDNSGTTTEMRISYDGATWEAWQGYSSSPIDVLLPQVVIDNADGDVTVYIQYRDAAGNESDVYSNAIEFATLPAIVTSTADTIADDALTTLREAILLGSLRPTQPVTFDAALYGYGPATITLAGAQLELVRNIQIAGPGVDRVTIDADGLSRIFYVDEGVTASIAGLAVTGGLGDAIYNSGGQVSVVDSLIHNNASRGIYSLGRLDVINSTITGNSGGGLYNGSFGEAHVLNTTIAGNSSSGEGGGIHSAFGSTLTVTNSVIVGNSASGPGGGIRSVGWSLTVTNSTITGNTGERGGGIDGEDFSVTLLHNSIVSGNESNTDPLYDDLYSSLDPSSSFNIISDDPDFLRDPEPGIDGIWGTVDDDFGNLRLAPGSPGIDAGNNALAVDDQGTPLTVDIAGGHRIINGIVDIGAYEQQPVLFVESSTTLGVGNKNSDVDLADLDGDGDLDAFVTGSDAENQVWLNEGDGTYVHTQSFGFGYNVYAALGDIDNDGDVDAVIAVRSSASPEVVLWENDGSGHFSNAGSLTADSPVDVALGDLNRDGKVDIYIAQWLDRDLIYFNNGSGGFPTPTQLPDTGNLQSKGVELVDLDEDGDLDAFIAKLAGSGGATNTVWFNDGNGIFTDSGQLLGNGRSQHVALGDLDQDGDIDALVVNSLGFAEPNHVWLNDGTGHFMVTGQSLGNWSGSHVALADFDLDGDLDAFVANWQDQGDRVWINDGAGQFFESQSLGADTSSHVALGDIDRDGDIDAVVATASTSQPNRIWLNTTREPTTRTGLGFVESSASLGVGTNNSDVDLADLDGDGDLDALVTARNAENQVWLNEGDGTYVHHESFGSGANGYAALGDFDNDGDVDAVIVVRTAKVVTLWTNDGSGHFSEAGSLAADSPVDVGFGDLNQDGKIDVYIAQWLDRDLIYFNNGSGGFSTPTQLPGNGNLQSKSVELADLDQDGDLDVFVAKLAGSGGAANMVWFNDGKGVFTDSGQLLGNSRSQHVALGDLDQDGDIDALVANSQGFAEPNHVWLNDGTGHFTMTLQSLGNWSGSHVALADFDQDGDLDAFVANWQDQGDRVWLNNGLGYFIDSQSLGTDVSSHVALGDIDRDGDIDAVVATFDSSQPNRIWLNDGFLTPTTPVPGDFNADGIVDQGDLDLVLLNWGSLGNPAPTGWVNDLPDSTIGQNELDRVKSNWGNTSSAAVSETVTAATAPVSDQSLQAWWNEPRSFQLGPRREIARDRALSEFVLDNSEPAQRERVFAVVAETQRMRRMGPHQETRQDRDRLRDRVLDLSLADYLDGELWHR